MIPVILAGGIGSRLWPLSRELYPKHLLSLYGEDSLLQATFKRAACLPNIQKILIISNHQHRFLVEEQLQALESLIPFEIILEPCGRNTAAAVALAANYVTASEVLLVLPGDHLIEDVAQFVQAVDLAEQQASKAQLVLFGVRPNRAETGYGYIEVGHKLDDDVYQISQFTEKPNQAVAEGYCTSGKHYWNSGMFSFQAGQYLAELQQCAPDVAQYAAKAMQNSQQDLNFLVLEAETFQQCPDVSIDYAVMEKTRHAVMIPLHSMWSDIGAWLALYEVEKKDQHGNVRLGHVIAQQANNNYLRAESRLLAVHGIDNCIVVETPDAVLVTNKDDAQGVKQLVSELKRTERGEVNAHLCVYQPWGHYETINQGDGFCVRKVTIKPGKCIAKQIHQHRAEHWVIVSGEGLALKGEEEFKLQLSQSTYIPAGVEHQLQNIGEENLEVIEVQTGKLFEDDVKRV